MKRKIILILYTILTLSLCACAKNVPVITETSTETMQVIQNDVTIETTQIIQNEVTEETMQIILTEQTTEVVQSESFTETTAVSEVSSVEEEKAEDHAENLPNDFYGVCTNYSKTEVEGFAKKIRKYITSKDWGSLSKHVSYPISISGHSYNDKVTFAKGEFADMLNNQFFEAVGNESCTDMFCNWQGVMLGDGEVWIAEVNGELKVFSINVTTPSDTIISTVQEAQDAFVEFFSEDGIFYDRDSKRETSIQDYCKGETERVGLPVEIVQIAAADMDEDGIKEVVLNIGINSNVDNAVWVLHYQNGEIQGQLYYYRQLGHIKADGSFWRSGNSSNNGAARLIFGENEWRYVDVNPQGFDEKPDVHWVDYPCNDIEGLLN